MSEGLTLSQLAEKNALLVTENAALQQKLDAVLAENAEIKSGIVDITFMRDDDFFASTKEAQRVMGNLVNIKTTATDAILNEVRADGVEKFACYWESNCAHDDTFVGKKAKHFANQLRAVSTEGGV